MIKYLTVLAKSFKSQLIYRSTAFFSFISSLLWFVIQVSLWKALIGSGIKNGTTLYDMIAFIAINSIIHTLTNANIASMIETSVIDGSVSMHLLRPISYKWYLFFSIVGQNLYRVFTNVLPVIVLSVLFIGITLPPSATYLILFIVSIVIGMLIMFELTYVVGLLAFWIQRCWFLRWYLNAGTDFFGGTIIPLWFYPRVLNRISYFLPFRYISFEPINFYLGKTPLNQSGYIILYSAAWLLILIIIDNIMWRMATLKLTINGG